MNEPKESHIYTVQDLVQTILYIQGETNVQNYTSIYFTARAIQKNTK